MQKTQFFLKVFLISSGKRNFLQDLRRISFVPYICLQLLLLYLFNLFCYNMVTLYVECILPLAIVVSDEGTSL